jgi:hypothetical protein
MIEIVVAIVLLVIGLVGIIALFPINLEQNKKTVSKSYAADAAEQFLRFNSTKIETDWTFSNAYPVNAMYTGDESEIQWSTTSLIINSNLKVYFVLNDGDDPEVEFNPNVHQSGLFKLEQLSEGNVDFSAIIRGWQTFGSIVLHIELSYPSEIPYEARSKAEFSVRCVRNVTVQLEPGPANGLQTEVNPPDEIEEACVTLPQVNINPGNSNNNEFCLVTPDGVTYTRDNMLNGTLGPTGVEYIGPATKVFIKSKTQSKTFLLNGVKYELANNTAYEIVGELTAYVYSASTDPTKTDGFGNMGHWWICLNAMSATCVESNNSCAN